MSDLQSKYQILAAEYAKLRAQIPVLKKAVLDEQAVEEQLKETIKEKDQSIRKLEQETDSLVFRNQQLSTRVAVLQKELEDASIRSKKTKTKNSSIAEANNSSHATNSIIDEELKSKIEENVRLHRKVYESDQDHQAELLRLQKRLEILEAESTQHQTVLNDAVTMHREKINKLQEDKAILEAKLQKQEKETREAVRRSKELEEKVKTLENEMGGQLRHMSDIIEHKLTFNDTADQTFNTLNLPTVDGQQQQQSRELISQANTLVRDLMNATSDFYSHSEQRAKLLSASTDSERLAEVNKQYCELLNKNVSIFKDVKQSFEVFHKSIGDDSLILLETAVQLKDFAVKWKALASLTQKLLPYQMQSLEEESALSSCPATLSAKNKELRSSLELMCSSSGHVEHWITQLATWGEQGTEHSRTSQTQLFERLSKTLNDFHETVRELSRHFNAKLSLEHQLPTVTQKLKTVDESILTSVISLVTCTGKISAFFSGNLSLFTLSSASVNDGVPLNSAVSDLHRRAVDYMQLIQRPQAESVPYNTAVQNRKTVYSFTESKDTLSQQVIKLQEKVNELEAEREHWMLETQLLQLKYQKVIQNNEGAVKTRPTSASKFEGSRVTQDGENGSNDASQVAGVDVKDSGEMEAREQLITKHYQSRLTDITSKLQLADSISLHFSAECRALQKRLQISDVEKQRLHSELSSANKSVAQLKDELQTTTRSYEAQLSMMSEHLAGMNERLTTQKDEIDLLKYELQQQNNTSKTKSVKKGRTG